MLLRKKSEADWAVQILSEKQEAMYFYDLIEAVASKMDKKKETTELTSIYTRLNLDNRLVYKGSGFWYYDANKIRKGE